jgi:hypothetical protein
VTSCKFKRLRRQRSRLILVSAPSFLQQLVWVVLLHQHLGLVYLSLQQQSASSNVNTLDDYEEGTWTPTLKTTSTNFSSITYSSQIGDYVKIGSYIYCQFFVQIASVSGGSGNIQLTGLPFASSGSGRPNSGGYVQLVNGWTTNNPSNFDASGASSLDYNIQYRATSNGVTVALPVAAATASAYMRGTILIKQ